MLVRRGLPYWSVAFQKDVQIAALHLDLDLIAYGRVVLAEPGLVIPHPRAHERRFVMGPLAEIAPDWVHPVLAATAGELAADAAIGSDAAPLAAASR